MMAYEPTEWEAGMKVTASRLNKIEEGIVEAGKVYKVTLDMSDYTINVSYDDLMNLVSDGYLVFCIWPEEVGEVSGTKTITHIMRLSNLSYYPEDAAGEPYGAEFVALVNTGNISLQYFSGATSTEKLTWQM